MVSETNKNNFEYTIKVRNTIEEIDKIVERAEVNINVLADTILLSYDISKRNNKLYNMGYINEINVLIKSALMNSPGVDGSWFQINADLPYASRLYSWYEYQDGKIADVKAQLKNKTSDLRELNPKDDPYYF